MSRPHLALACITAGLASAASADFMDPPRPEVFLRTQDQQRARLLTTPCRPADVGHGCYRYDSRLIRESPCAYHIDALTIGSRPTDQCVRMEPPRRYRGIWVDAFEGQRFIADGTAPPEWPRTDPTSPGWREQAERARAAAIWLDVSRVQGVGHDYRNGPRRMAIEFVGRKTMFPGAYGHMGMSSNEIIVDRLISLKPAK